MIKVKDMMNRHKENTLNIFRHRTTNAESEGLKTARSS